MNISYKDIHDDIKTIATSHEQIRKFITGPVSEMDIGKLDATEYPFCYAELTNVSIDRGAMTFDVDIVVAQLIQDDYTDRVDAYDSTLLALKDICVAILLRQSGTSVTSQLNNRIDLQLPLDCVPFTARFENDLTGWQSTISITADSDNDLCEAPYA